QAIQVPGSTLGLEALLTGHYGQSLDAEGPCDLLWLPLSQVRSIAARDPVLARNISDAIQTLLTPSPQSDRVGSTPPPPAEATQPGIASADHDR
ncbi:MAG: hypothetical protein LRY38_03840, partial [Aeromonadaceae bacterium]|nr:hypothetical protein [Aeromonadaceae bacterium]